MTAQFLSYVAESAHEFSAADDLVSEVIPDDLIFDAGLTLEVADWLAHNETVAVACHRYRRIYSRLSVSDGELAETYPAAAPDSRPDSDESFGNQEAVELQDEIQEYLAAERAEAVVQAYSLRIGELRGYGEEEGVAVNPDSEADFWAFIKAHQDWRRGLMELMGSGNLRAVWKNRAEGRHLGLQFLGRQEVEYVIFLPGPESGEVLREAGIDDFAGLNRRINDAGLLPLVRP